MVVDTLCLLACARHGLSESEVKKMNPRYAKKTSRCEGFGVWGLAMGLAFTAAAACYLGDMMAVMG